jgi:hypothetical protein
VQGVTQGTGVTIAANGQISFDSATAAGVMRLNNPAGYNALVWPSADGTAGQQLTTDGAGNLAWTASGSPAYTGKGQISVGTGAGTSALLPVGTDGNVLTADSTSATGLKWAPAASTAGLGIDITGGVVKVSIPAQFGPPAPGTLPAESVDGSLYWDNNLGLLFIRYNDSTSTQWVQVVPSGGGSTTYTGTAPVKVTGSAISLDIGLGNTTDGGFLKASTDIRNGPPTAGTGQLQAIDGSLYWDNNQGLLFIRYHDGNTTQWVQVTPVTPAPTGFSGSFLSQGGQTVTVSNGNIVSVV